MTLNKEISRRKGSKLHSCIAEEGSSYDCENIIKSLKGVHRKRKLNGNCSERINKEVIQIDNIGDCRLSTRKQVEDNTPGTKIRYSGDAPRKRYFTTQAKNTRKNNSLSSKLKQCISAVKQISQHFIKLDSMHSLKNINNPSKVSRRTGRELRVKRSSKSQGPQLYYHKLAKNSDRVIVSSFTTATSKTAVRIASSDSNTPVKVYHTKRVVSESSHIINLNSYRRKNTSTQETAKHDRKNLDYDEIRYYKNFEDTRNRHMGKSTPSSCKRQNNQRPKLNMLENQELHTNKNTKRKMEKRDTPLEFNLLKKKYSEKNKGYKSTSFSDILKSIYTSIKPQKSVILKKPLSTRAKQNIQVESNKSLNVAILKKLSLPIVSNHGTSSKKTKIEKRVTSQSSSSYNNIMEKKGKSHVNLKVTESSDRTDSFLKRCLSNVYRRKKINLDNARSTQKIKIVDDTSFAPCDYKVYVCVPGKMNPKKVEEVILKKKKKMIQDSDINRQAKKIKSSDIQHQDSDVIRERSKSKHGLHNIKVENKDFRSSSEAGFGSGTSLNGKQELKSNISGKKKKNDVFTIRKAPSPDSSTEPQKSNKGRNFSLIKTNTEKDLRYHQEKSEKSLRVWKPGHFQINPKKKVHNSEFDIKTKKNNTKKKAHHNDQDIISDNEKLGKLERKPARLERGRKIRHSVSKIEFTGKLPKREEKRSIIQIKRTPQQNLIDTTQNMRSKRVRKPSILQFYKRRDSDINNQQGNLFHKNVPLRDNIRDLDKSGSHVKFLIKKQKNEEKSSIFQIKKPKKILNTQSSYLSQYKSTTQEKTPSVLRMKKTERVSGSSSESPFIMGVHGKKMAGSKITEQAKIPILDSKNRKSTREKKTSIIGITGEKTVQISQSELDFQGKSSKEKKPSITIKSQIKYSQPNINPNKKRLSLFQIKKEKKIDQRPEKKIESKNEKLSSNDHKKHGGSKTVKISKKRNAKRDTNLTVSEINKEKNKIKPLSASEMELTKNFLELGRPSIESHKSTKVVNVKTKPIGAFKLKQGLKLEIDEKKNTKKTMNAIVGKSKLVNTANIVNSSSVSGGPNVIPIYDKNLGLARKSFSKQKLNQYTPKYKINKSRSPENRTSFILDTTQTIGNKKKDFSRFPKGNDEQLLYSKTLEKKNSQASSESILRKEKLSVKEQLKDIKNKLSLKKHSPMKTQIEEVKPKNTPEKRSNASKMNVLLNQSDQKSTNWLRIEPKKIKPLNRLSSGDKDRRSKKQDRSKIKPLKKTISYDKTTPSNNSPSFFKNKTSKLFPSRIGFKKTDKKSYEFKNINDDVKKRIVKETKLNENKSKIRSKETPSKKNEDISFSRSNVKPYYNRELEETKNSGFRFFKNKTSYMHLQPETSSMKRQLSKKELKDKTVNNGASETKAYKIDKSNIYFTTGRKKSVPRTHYQEIKTKSYPKHERYSTAKIIREPMHTIQKSQFEISGSNEKPEQRIKNKRKIDSYILIKDLNKKRSKITKQEIEVPEKFNSFTDTNTTKIKGIKKKFKSKISGIKRSTSLIDMNINKLDSSKEASNFMINKTPTEKLSEDLNKKRSKITKQEIEVPEKFNSFTDTNTTKIKGIKKKFKSKKSGIKRSTSLIDMNINKLDSSKEASNYMINKTPTEKLSAVICQKAAINDPKLTPRKKSSNKMSKSMSKNKSKNQNKSRQSVKVGSDVSFNITFFKDKSSLSNPIEKTRGDENKNDRLKSKKISDKRHNTKQKEEQQPTTVKSHFFSQNSYYKNTIQDPTPNKKKTRQSFPNLFKTRSKSSESQGENYALSLPVVVASATVNMRRAKPRKKPVDPQKEKAKRQADWWNKMMTMLRPSKVYVDAKEGLKLETPIVKKGLKLQQIEGMKELKDEEKKKWKAKKEKEKRKKKALKTQLGPRTGAPYLCPGIGVDSGYEGQEVVVSDVQKQETPPVPKESIKELRKSTEKPKTSTLSEAETNLEEEEEVSKSESKTRKSSIFSRKKTKESSELLERKSEESLEKRETRTSKSRDSKKLSKKESKDAENKKKELAKCMLLAMNKQYKNVDPTRQSCKIGTNFEFDVEFFKDRSKFKKKKDSDDFFAYGLPDSCKLICEKKILEKNLRKSSLGRKKSPSKKSSFVSKHIKSDNLSTRSSTMTQTGISKKETISDARELDLKNKLTDAGAYTHDKDDNDDNEEKYSASKKKTCEQITQTGRRRKISTVDRSTEYDDEPYLIGISIEKKFVLKSEKYPTEEKVSEDIDMICAPDETYEKNLVKYARQLKNCLGFKFSNETKEKTSKEGELGDKSSESGGEKPRKILAGTDKKVCEAGIAKQLRSCFCQIGINALNMGKGLRIKFKKAPLDGTYPDMCPPGTCSKIPCDPDDCRRLRKLRERKVKSVCLQTNPIFMRDRLGTNVCEPNFCDIEVCCPYNCEKRIKIRNMKKSKKDIGAQSATVAIDEPLEKKKGPCICTYELEQRRKSPKTSFVKRTDEFSIRLCKTPKSLRKSVTESIGYTRDPDPSIKRQSCSNRLFRNQQAFQLHPARYRSEEIKIKKYDQEKKTYAYGIDTITSNKRAKKVHHEIDKYQRYAQRAIRDDNPQLYDVYEMNKPLNNQDIESKVEKKLDKLDSLVQKNKLVKAVNEFEKKISNSETPSAVDVNEIEKTSDEKISSGSSPQKDLDKEPKESPDNKNIESSSKTDIENAESKKTDESSVNKDIESSKSSKTQNIESAVTKNIESTDSTSSTTVQPASALTPKADPRKKIDVDKNKPMTVEQLIKLVTTDLIKSPGKTKITCSQEKKCTPYMAGVYDFQKRKGIKVPLRCLDKGEVECPLEIVINRHNMHVMNDQNIRAQIQEAVKNRRVELGLFEGTEGYEKIGKQKRKDDNYDDMWGVDPREKMLAAKRMKQGEKGSSKTVMNVHDSKTKKDAKDDKTKSKYGKDRDNLKKQGEGKSDIDEKSKNARDKIGDKSKSKKQGEDKSEDKSDETTSSKTSKDEKKDMKSKDKKDDKDDKTSKKDDEDDKQKDEKGKKEQKDKKKKKKKKGKDADETGEDQSESEDSKKDGRFGKLKRFGRKRKKKAKDDEEVCKELFKPGAKIKIETLKQLVGKKCSCLCAQCQQPPPDPCGAKLSIAPILKRIEEKIRKERQKNQQAIEEAQLKELDELGVHIEKGPKKEALPPHCTFCKPLPPPPKPPPQNINTSVIKVTRSDRILSIITEPSCKCDPTCDTCKKALLTKKCTCGSEVCKAVAIRYAEGLLAKQKYKLRKCKCGSKICGKQIKKLQAIEEKKFREETKIQMKGLKYKERKKKDREKEEANELLLEMKAEQLLMKEEKRKSKKGTQVQTKERGLPPRSKKDKYRDLMSQQMNLEREQMSKEFQDQKRQAGENLNVLTDQQKQMRERMKMEELQEKQKEKELIEQEKLKRLEKKNKLRELKKTRIEIKESRDFHSIVSFIKGDITFEDMKKRLKGIKETKLEKKERLLRNKRNKKRKLLLRKRREARWKREDDIRRKKRIKDDKYQAKKMRQFEGASDTVLICEGILDCLKLGFNMIIGCLRCLIRRIIDIPGTYRTIKDCIIEPKRISKLLKASFRNSGIVATFQRIRARFWSLKCIKAIKACLEANACTRYLINLCQRDPRKRIKKPKYRERIDFNCSLYMGTLRTKPCLWCYDYCPSFYPHCISLINFYHSIVNIIYFFLAIFVWSPCIIGFEICRACLCCMMCI